MEKTKNILMFTGEVEGSKEKKRGGGGRVQQIFLILLFDHFCFPSFNICSAAAKVFSFKSTGLH